MLSSNSGLNFRHFIDQKADQLDNLPGKIIESQHASTTKTDYSSASSVNWRRFKPIADSVTKWDIEAEPDFPTDTNELEGLQMILNGIAREDQNKILVTADVCPHLNINVLLQDRRLKFSSKKQSFQSHRYHLKGKDDLSIIIIEIDSKIKRASIEIKTMATMNHESWQQKFS